MSTSRADVAKWMVDQIAEKGYLYQGDAAAEIEVEFGPEWIYENDNGNSAIHRGVLAEFNKIKPADVEWDRSDKSWS